MSHTSGDAVRGASIRLVDPSSRTTNRGLEFLRGAAAVLVLVSHCRLYPYLAAGQDPSGRSALESVFLVPASFGRESVAVFFVLSGYLVGGQVLTQVRSGRFSPRAFAARRTARFVVVLLPGLVFTAGLDALSRATLPSLIPPDQGTGTSTLGTFLCNGALLMDSRCEPFGTNASLWSLGYEFWFYAVFAAATVSTFAFRRGRRRTAFVAAGIAVVCTAVYGPVLLTLIPAWLLGAGTANLRRRPGVTSSVARRPWLALGLALAAFGVGLAISQPIDALAPKYLVLGLLTWPLVLVLAIVEVRPSSWAAPVERFGVWVGLWSFTLYVFHLPVVMFTMLVGARLGVPVGPLTVYAQAALVLLLVRPMFWVGERHTVAVRTWLDKVLAGSPSSV